METSIGNMKLHDWYYLIIILVSCNLCSAVHRRSYTITTVLEDPYVMIRRGSSSHGGIPSFQSTDYEGYLVDLIDILSREMNFRYKLIPVFDGEYAIKRPDKSWGGMIGELQRRQADIAAGAMFSTERRAEVADFTEPFMYVNACLVIRKTETGILSKIDSVEDVLFNRENVRFGTLDQGIIRKNFKITEDTIEQLLYREMTKYSMISPFTKSTLEGLENVRRDNYIFIMPDNTAKYIASRQPCDLKVVDNFLMREGLRLAVQKGSELLKRINYRLERMRSDGTLDMLYKKWWIDKSQCHKNNTGGINEPHQSSHDGACQLTITSLVYFCCAFCIFIYNILQHLPFFNQPLLL